MNSVFNYTLGEFNESSVWLHHRYINASDSSNQNSEFKYTSLHLSTPPSSLARFSVTQNATANGSLVINVFTPSSGGSLVRVRVLSNETSLPGLNPPALFLNESDATTPGVLTALQKLRSKSGGFGEAAQQVSDLIGVDRHTN